MNTLVFEAGLSDHHKLRVKVSWTHYYLKQVDLISLRVKSSWTQ